MMWSDLSASVGDWDGEIELPGYGGSRTHRALTEDDWDNLEPLTREAYNQFADLYYAQHPAIKVGPDRKYVMVAHQGREGTELSACIGGGTQPGSVLVLGANWRVTDAQGVEHHIPADQNHPYDMAEVYNMYHYGTRKGVQQADAPTLRREVTATSLAERFRAELYDLESLETIEPPEFLIDGYLVRDSIAQLFADPRSGKSFLSIDWMMHIADGRDWHGHEVKKPEPVLYIIGEGKGGIRSRVKAWQKHHGTSDAIRRNLHLLGMPVNLTRAEHVDAFMPLVKEIMPTLIIIDTLARATAGADGSGDKDMGIALEHADQIRRETGACVLVVHHTGHQNKERARGSSAIFAALQSEFRLDRDKNKQEKLTLTTTKQKDHDELEPHYMYLQKIELGDAETSLVITHNKDQQAEESTAPEWLATRLGDLYQALVEATDTGQTPTGRKEWLDTLGQSMSNNQFTGYKDKLVSLGVCRVVGDGAKTKYLSLPLQPKKTPLRVTMSHREASA